MAERLSPDLEHFVRDNVESIEQLQVLLLLHSDRKPWTIGEAAKALKMAPIAVEAALHHLVTRGLVREPVAVGGPFLYAAGREAVDSLVRALAVAREEQTAALTQFLTSMAMERMRQAMLRAFTEAFRLRRPPDD